MDRPSADTFTLLAVILLLFTAMLEPLLSATLAAGLLLLYGFCRWRRRSGGGK
jgi:hypothetical protein